MNLLPKILVALGSAISLGFGIWHFFVPQIWNWSSFIDHSAPELAVAIRAVNFFFSLSLVLFGAVNLLLICGEHSNRYSILVMLSATCALWIARVVFQVIHPQGSLFPVLQYGMLATFVIVSLCYLLPLLGILFQKTPI